MPGNSIKLFSSLRVGPLAWLQLFIVSRWAIDHPSVWNSLQKGTSVLEVVVVRALRIDLGVSAGLSTFVGLFDITKFVEHIRLSTMIEAGLKLEFCPIVMFMALLMHTAPRTLCISTSAGKYFTDPIYTSCWSILAGCATSVDFTASFSGRS